MSHLKLIHFLVLAFIGLALLAAFLASNNLLLGLLASSISVTLTLLAWTSPKARAFIEQHNRLLRLIIGTLYLATSAGYLFLPASHPLKQNIRSLYLIAFALVTIVYFKPSETKG